MTPTDPTLAKIFVHFPYHWVGVGGESFRARSVGKDQYRLENVPYYAYGLNYLDIVHAVPASADLIPLIRRVVKRSGHETLRVTFEKPTSPQAQSPYLDGFESRGLIIERISTASVALSVPPEVSYNDIYAHIKELQGLGIIGFETCGVRVRGGFGAKPPEPEGA